jgi:hypothetical protein
MIAEFPSSAPEWKPDQALTDQLGEEQRCTPHRIRAPKGYKMSEFSERWLDSSIGGNFLFHPNNRPGFFPIFLVGPGKMFGKELEQDPESIFDQSVAQVRDQYKFGADFTRQKTDYVRINGIGWRRCQFSGTAKPSTEEEKCKGAYYLAVDGDWSLPVYAIVPEANQEVLKQVDAAIYTLKK